MVETSVRLLRLLTLLQGHRDWSGTELADRLAVSTRTVRTDVERLRVLGYRIESRPGVAGGYRLGAGSALPPLLLDDDEAVAVAVGLRAAASGSVRGIEETSLRALAKLEQALPSRLRHRVDALRAATVSAAAGGPTVDAETLTAVSTAVHRQERLRFDYAGHDGTATVRDVEPYRLVYTGRRWYLLGWDTDRADWRTFRADRIQPRVPGGPRFTPREPPGGDAVAHVLRGVGSTAWPHPARVRLHAPADRMAQRIPSTAGLLEAIDEHSCLLHTGGESLSNLAAFLGTLEVDLDVLDPPELRDVLRGVAARLGRAAQVS
ncbi:helix-turn-helix transcriptional regulator [Micromonospora sp. NBC_00858]|uniref:helix-turn-helix transcriptional regulator n=1 Tax=Micromonospora sp. NBC_00858 TaxID=2975979 RepID=UPI0038694821|nr:YafY family transcriptional regulator [Micromonospora sp. NBC_00858]